MEKELVSGIAYSRDEAKVTLTGVTVGFGLFETMVILSKPEVLRRIAAAVKMV